jgi:hypothetical protein
LEHSSINFLYRTGQFISFDSIINEIHLPVNAGQQKENIMIVFAALSRFASAAVYRYRRARLTRAMESLSPDTRKDIGWPTGDLTGRWPERPQIGIRAGGRTH